MARAERHPEFRRVTTADRAQVLAIAARTWEGQDYLPVVFDRWVADQRAFFGALVREGQLIGCARVAPLDATRGWLEGMRVHPDYQRQGLGRAIAHHLIARALSLGLRELLFATYFDNASSIRISEQLGFRRLATYTNLELHQIPADLAESPGITTRSGIPDAAEMMWNDWFCAPPGMDRREQQFPGALTISGHGGRLGLADNSKFASTLEISWIDPHADPVPAPLVRFALGEARRRGRTQVHLMLPAGCSLAPFRELGFAYYEREGDVWLYAARTAELRL